MKWKTTKICPTMNKGSATDSIRRVFWILGRSVGIWDSDLIVRIIIWAKTENWELILGLGLKAEKSYKLVSATSISDEEKDVLRKCMLEYVETHLREGRGIWYTIPISIPRDNPNGYLPEQLYFSGMDAPIIVVIGIRRYYGVPPGRLSPQDIERLMGPSGDRSRFSGSICLSSKILLQPLWAYINASTTLIPSTLVTLEDKGQMEFITWKDRSGTSMEMTNFKHLDWEYDSSLSSNEHLKTAVLLYLFKQRDKQQLSLTSKLYPQII